MVWRYISTTFVNLLAASLLQGGIRSLVSGIYEAGWHFVISLFLGVLMNFTFTFSLILVDPAKALLLVSLNPLWAALLGYLILGDKIPCRTIVAQGLALVSVLLLFVPSMLAPVSAVNASDLGTGSAEDADASDAATLAPFMDLLPLCTGISIAAFVVAARYTSMKRPSASLEAVPCIASLFTFSLALVLDADELTASPRGLFALVDGLEPRFWFALLMNALGVGAYNVSLVVAPRYITSAECALIFLLETAVGPVWVYFGFGDVPSTWTIASGALLLTTLIAHEIAGACQGQQAGGVGRENSPGLFLSSTSTSPRILAIGSGEHRSWTDGEDSGDVTGDRSLEDVSLALEFGSAKSSGGSKLTRLAAPLLPARSRSDV
jgi:drug/metabolite transporter (DMT)-like permease